MKRSRRSVKTMLRALYRLGADSRGATAIEYGLIAAIVVVGLIAAIAGLGNATSGTWNNTNTRYGAVAPQ